MEHTDPSDTRNTQLSIEQLDRYLAQVASAEERVRVEAWLAAEPGRRLDALVGDRSAARKEAVLGRVLGAGRRVEKVGGTDARAEVVRKGTRSGVLGWQSLRGFPTLGRQTLRGRLFAAMLLSAAAISVGIRTLAPRSSSASHTYTTTTGQQAVITLRDGSRVTVAPQSQLTIPVGFGRSTRTVDLEGEAYFDVRTAAGTPFVVRTGAIITRVLGTTFDIRRYPTDRVTLVAVTAGKVVIGGSRERISVVARTMALVTDSTATLRAIGDLDEYTGWIHGRLVFDDAPVLTALATLGRWYGYNFRLADSVVAHKRLTGEFRADALDETLTGLKKVLNVTMTFSGTTITLAPLRTGASLPVWKNSHDALLHPTEIGR